MRRSGRSLPKKPYYIQHVEISCASLQVGFLRFAGKMAGWGKLQDFVHCNLRLFQSSGDSPDRPLPFVAPGNVFDLQRRFGYIKVLGECGGINVSLPYLMERRDSWLIENGIVCNCLPVLTSCAWRAECSPRHQSLRLHQSHRLGWRNTRVRPAIKREIPQIAPTVSIKKQVQCLWPTFPK